MKYKVKGCLFTQFKGCQYCEDLEPTDIPSAVDYAYKYKKKLILDDNQNYLISIYAPNVKEDEPDILVDSCWTKNL